jgi:hypothetical protein
MKKIIGILFVGMFLIGCQTPQFLVVGKKSNGVLDNCIVQLLPINKKAEKYSYVKDALVSCYDYECGDTLYLTRKEFTNF